jgi:hypothetical protein
MKRRELRETVSIAQRHEGTEQGTRHVLISGSSVCLLFGAERVGWAGWCRAYHADSHNWLVWTVDRHLQRASPDDRRQLLVRLLTLPCLWDASACLTAAGLRSVRCRVHTASGSSRHFTTEPWAGCDVNPCASFLLDETQHDAVACLLASSRVAPFSQACPGKSAHNQDTRMTRPDKTTVW